MRLRRLIEDEETGVEFSLPRHQKEGVSPNGGMEDLMRIFLAGWRSTPFKMRLWPDGTEEYENDFSASYGWENVMISMFETLAAYLMDGSEIEICPDSGRDRLVVINGKAV